MTHDNTNTQTFRKTSTYAMVVTALMAAVTCILAPLSVPIGPVPISLTNFAIYLSLYLLRLEKGTLSYLIYLLLGLVGLPVFSGFTGGLANWQVRPADTSSDLFQWQSSQVLSSTNSPTVESKILGMIVGTAICYAFGTAWFCLQAGYTVGAALAVCVIPFIPADLCKMVIAMIIGPMVRKRLGTVAQQ